MNRSGLTLCNEIALGKKCWDDLFEPVSFFSMYRCVYNYNLMTALYTNVPIGIIWLLQPQRNQRNTSLNGMMSQNLIYFDVKQVYVGLVW